MHEESENNGAENTRQKLLKAGLLLFGLHGFEATATRALAAEAGVNLGAIRYHFGGKDGLYRAVLEQAVEVKIAEIGPILERVAAVCAAPATETGTVRQGLRDMTRGVVEVMLGNPSSLQFSRIMLQEQISPTTGFDILYKGFLSKVLDAWSMLLARLTGLDVDAPELRLRAMAVMGQFVIFRVGMPSILKKLDLDRLGPEQLEAVAAIGVQHIESIVDGFVPVLPEVGT